MRIVFKRFNFIFNHHKNNDFDISDKEHSGCPVAVEEGEFAERLKKIVETHGKYFD